MVKGVNKTVIEVNNTGSLLFEKIVFYVSPDYGNLSAKQLKKAASAFSFNYSTTKKSSLRKKYRLRKRRIFFCITAFAVLVFATALIILL